MPDILLDAILSQLKLNYMLMLAKECYGIGSLSEKDYKAFVNNTFDTFIKSEKESEEE